MSSKATIPSPWVTTWATRLSSTITTRTWIFRFDRLTPLGVKPDRLLEATP
ncbi:MAG: hypothetical protein IIA44_08075 [Acidobacteria bacterium]|nr:hypothetical protein [Acidobacteriota bacterium]